MKNSSSYNIYHSETYFNKEQNKIFLELPILTTHIKYIQHSNSAMFTNYMGRSIILTMDDHQNTHILLNMCTHRGAQLNLIKKNKICYLKCPYHAWSFHLDGCIHSIPNQATFHSLHKNELTLEKWKNINYLGFIFMNADKYNLLKSYQNFLKEIKLDNYIVYLSYSITKKINWKLIVDIALEQYHFQSTHEKTISKYFKSNKVFTVESNPNIKITFYGELKKNKNKNSKIKVVLYFFFPNTFILFTKGIYSMLTILPQSTCETELSIVHFASKKVLSLADNTKINKHLHFLREVLEEDLEVVMSIQKNLKYAKKHFTLSSLENNVTRFHSNLNSFINL